MRVKNICRILSVALAATVCPAQQPAKIAPQVARYGQLPLTFEENRGQTDPQVRFLSRAKGYTAFLTANGIVLSLRPTELANPANTSTPSSQQKRSGNTALEFKLVGAASNINAVGEDPQPGRANYFIGNDRTKWRTNVQTYRQVRYTNVYPGVDLIYYGNHRQLEYDFAVAPHADPTKIQFEIKGANQLTIGTEGDLIVKLASGELHFHAPTVYQEVNGMRAPLQGGYVIKSATRVGFQVADYNSANPLVIDPVLDYSTYLGGSGDDQPTGIAVDSTGSVYVTGYTDSSDFPLATLGSLPPGTDHVFVAKFDPTGSNLIYADYIGGSNEDFGYALVLDSSNEVYIAGSTASSDFPVVNAFQSTYPGSFNAFLTKVSADGSALLYSTYLGGNGSDEPNSVQIDNLSNVLVAGVTSSTNFPVANAYQSTAPTNQGGLYGNYGFLTKFTPDGSSLVYSTYLAGSSNVPDNCGGNPCWTEPVSGITGMALDSAGNAYVTGATNTYDFPTTSGAYLGTDSTQMNAFVGFVSKINSAGNLQYSTYFYEPSGFTDIHAIAVDASGSAYITGLAYSNGSFPITSTGICDPSVSGVACSYAFVTKFDATASTLVYSTFLGANNYAAPAAILLDQSNDAYVLSTTSNNSFNTVNGLEPYAGGNDILLVEIDPAAGSQLFATYLGGSADENAAAMALDAAGNLYVTGTTDSTDFPTTQQAFQNQLAGNTDAFITKIEAVSAPLPSFTPNALQFSSLQVGSTSSEQQVVLRNMGGAALTIASTSTTGDFAETDNCGSNVPAAGSCTLSVTFTPTAAGQRAGTVVINDNAAGSPHTISLSGNGLAAIVSLTPANLQFSGVPVGGSSAAQTVTLSNQGNASLNISNVEISGDFSQTNNCPGVLSAGDSCTANVKFAPTASGNLSGSLTITDSGSGSSQSVALAGSGSDFALTTSSSSTSVKAGATATFALTVSPIGGSFTSPIQLSCSGAPASSTCSVSPASITPGSNPASVTVTVATDAASAKALPVLAEHRQPVFAFFVHMQGFGIFGLLLISKRLRKKGTILILLALLIPAMLFMSGCAGGTGIASQGSTGTTAGTYSITVTATSGGLHHSVPLTLTVQ